MTGYRAGPPDPMSGKDDGEGGASILVNWENVEVVGTRGFYNIYLKPFDDLSVTQRQYRGGQRQDRRWDRHEVPGRQNSMVLHNLRPGQPYFLVMDAQNRFGRSPYSELCSFRTADSECHPVSQFFKLLDFHRMTSTGAAYLRMGNDMQLRFQDRD